MSEELHYRAKQLTVPELEALLNDFWAQMQNPTSAVSQQAQEEGLDVEKLRTMRRDEVIQVRKDGDTLDPLVTPIVIAFLPVAAMITKDLWKHVVLPWIKGEKGGGRLTEDESKRSRE